MTTLNFRPAQDADCDENLKAAFDALSLDQRYEMRAALSQPNPFTALDDKQLFDKMTSAWVHWSLPTPKTLEQLIRFLKLSDEYTRRNEARKHLH